MTRFQAPLIWQAARLALLTLALSSSPLPAQNTATARAHCLSMYLGHIETLTEAIYFTTYDGAATLPLFDTVPQGSLFSGEFTPAGAGTYHADYCDFVFGQFYSYGTVSITFPTTDADRNGVPDFLQLDLAGSASFTGTLTMQYPNTATATISGRLTRPANSSIGAYTGLVVSGTNSYLYSGRTSIVCAIGQLAYTRGATNQGTFHLWLTDTVGNSNAVNGTAPFTVLSSNQVQFPTMSLTSTAGVSNNVRPFTLTRIGQTYTGATTVVDGNLSTSWPDYTQWVIQIDDPNDADGNGIPDLSDNLRTPSPKLTQLRRADGRSTFHAQNLAPYAAYSLQTSTDLSTWTTLQTLTTTTNWLEWTNSNPVTWQKRFYRLAFP